MLSGKLAKAERGELAIPLPIGYVRRPSGEAVLDPDEQAQHVVRLVFSTFRRLGTFNGVLRYLVEQEVQLPVRVHSGPAKGELEWRRPTRETLQIMLHNPVYAGYYAYGRRQVEPRRKVPGRPSTGRVVKDGQRVAGAAAGPAAGLHHAGGVRGEHRPDGRQPADRGHAGRAAGRLGAAVRAAALRPVRRAPHDGPLPRRIRGRAVAHGYTCAFYQINYGTGGRCQHIAGPALDAYVAGQVLDAVAPAALEVSMAAAAQAEDERAMLDKLWRQRIERARYAADRARRQYQLAEPENRLVARQLEAGWEAALAEAARLEADYQRFTEEQPASPHRRRARGDPGPGRDLPQVWNAPSTTQADRKELLRILIEDITATVMGDSELVDVTITWAGGHQTTGQAVRPVARLDQLSYYPALLARVTQLAAAGRNNRQIAGVLNAEGFRPPKRTSRFTGGQVRTLITQRGIRSQPKGRPAVLTSLAPGQWSACEVPRGFRTVHPLGWMSGKVKELPRPKKSFSPEFKDEAVKMVIETSRPIARVAKELGINEGTLGNWVGIYRREHAGEEPALTVNERARLRELERETRELKMENDFLKKAAAYFAKDHR